LVSLYGILALQRATLALVGQALRAMGLHHRRYYFMDPNTDHLLLVFHLLDEDDALGPPCIVDSTLAPYTWQAFQGLEDVFHWICACFNEFGYMTHNGFL